RFRISIHNLSFLAEDRDGILSGRHSEAAAKCFQAVRSVCIENRGRRTLVRAHVHRMGRKTDRSRRHRLILIGHAALHFYHFGFVALATKACQCDGETDAQETSAELNLRCELRHGAVQSSTETVSPSALLPRY